MYNIGHQFISMKIKSRAAMILKLKKMERLSKIGWKFSLVL